MMSFSIRSGVYALVSACVLSSLSATAGWSQSLTWLGTLPGTSTSEATGVSDDGKVVVGASRITSENPRNPRAFRWTASGGMKDLGTLPGYDYAVALGVSADGSVVVGRAENADRSRQRAFLWTAPWGMQDLGTLGGVVSQSQAVSPDGSIVVGAAQGSFGLRAFRWTAAGGMQDLGTLGGTWSEAYGVSADGSVVVGRASNAAGQWRAFRWTAAGGMQNLGTLPGYDHAVAIDVSADGSVVTGHAYNRLSGGRQYRAFRWTVAGEMQDLGTLGGNESIGYGISADGSVVVGLAQDAAGLWHAFRWTTTGGMENLNSTYASLLTPGSYLTRAYAISADGRYIVGRGYNATTGREEAFLLDTRCTLPSDVNNDGIVDDADLLQVLFSFGTRCN